MTPDKEYFGNLIRARRQNMIPPLTAAKFAKKIGISDAWLSQIERSKFIPAEDIIKRMAKELRWNSDDLLAMGGKISSDLKDIIINTPVEMGYLLRILGDFDHIKLLKIIAKAEHLEKGN